MRFLEQRITSSPDQAGRLRVSADFEMERSGTVLSFWFDLPEKHREKLAVSGNPWLILMMPIAMEAAEDITIPLPGDPHLIENLRGLMRVWHEWSPELQRVEIDAPPSSQQVSPTNHRGMFFSGGVDSFFTLLRHGNVRMGCGTGPVDTLIFAEGFDIPVHNHREIQLVRHSIESTAGAFERDLLPVATNLREPNTPYKRNWILSHGCAMATIAHLLEGHFSEVLISSTHEYGHLANIGSHPLTDPLLSSRSLRIIHDGACFSRTEKIAEVGKSAEALSRIRVCYAEQKHDNCGHCPKCLFTMAAIDALGLSHAATSFDWSAYSLPTLADLRLETEPQVHRAGELIAAARLHGRADLADALQAALTRSSKVRHATEVIRRVPILWRFEYRLQQLLLRRAALSVPSPLSNSNSRTPTGSA